MEEEWNILSFSELKDKVINGDISIQEVIPLKNKECNIQTNMTFLDYLLKYKNINHHNILGALLFLYRAFTEKFDELYQNETILNVRNRIFKEWFITPDNLIKEISMFGGGPDISTIKELFGKATNSLQEMEDLHKYQEDIPVTMKFSNDSPLSKDMKQVIQYCDNTSSHISEKKKTLLSFIQNFNDFNSMVYIDLSIKHKCLYLREEPSADIPDNIHHIYSNFVIIHNLLHKQLIHQHNSFVTMEKTLEERCKHMKGLYGQQETIAHIGDDDDDDDGEKGEEDDSDNESNNTFFD